MKKISRLWLLALALALACAFPAVAALAAGSEPAFYCAQNDLANHADVKDWNSGCYTCSAAMVLTSLGKSGATPYDIWRLNGNTSYMTSYAALEKAYQVKISAYGFGDATAAEKEAKIRALCKENPQGVFLQGTYPKNGKEQTHAVVAYLDSTGTLRVNNPGYKTGKGSIVGKNDKNFTNYGQFNKYRLFKNTASAGTSATLATPKLSKVESTATGVKVTWGKVSGAAKYRVFYKTGSGSWTKAGDTTSTSYTWTKAKNGTKYTFTVRCLSKDSKSYTSAFDTAGKSITYKKPATTLASPKLSKVENVAGGVKVTWGKVSGAAKYRVFYKTGSGSWTKAGDATGTSYTWKKAKSGTKYTFTVRCLSADSKKYTSSYNTTGKAITYIAAPKLSKVESTATGVKVTWGKVAGAAKYRVFYKTGSGKWTKAGDSTGTSYTWTKAKNNTKYTFTVRCLSKDSKSYTSAFDTAGKSITYKKPATTLATPKLSKVENVAGGVKVTWGKVSGAAKYRVFYKTGSGSWTKAGDATGTSYTWKKAKSGTKYTFTVRCLSKDSKSYTSAFDTTGKAITYIAVPAISKVESSATGVKVTWGKVAGAAKYRVFYKTGSGKWTKAGDTTSTSYTWTKAKSGTKYTFTVRCLSKDSKSYTSAFDAAGKAITYKKPASTSTASSNVPINEANFPDWTFRNCVATDFDTDGNGVLSLAERKAVTRIDVVVYGDVTSLKGIEYFPNVVEISCGSNKLTELDVSKNTKLIGLYCAVNQIEALDVSKNTALKELICQSNQLKTLDVSKNTQLEYLNCSSNQLKTLDVGKNNVLQELYCSSNQLKTLTACKSTDLTTLYCDHNELTALDVRANTGLKYLYCDHNQLPALDVTHNTVLRTLHCQNNKIKTLDLSKGTVKLKDTCKHDDEVTIIK